MIKFQSLIAANGFVILIRAHNINELILKCTQKIIGKLYCSIYSQFFTLLLFFFFSQNKLRLISLQLIFDDPKFNIFSRHLLKKFKDLIQRYNNNNKYSNQRSSKSYNLEKSQIQRQKLHLLLTFRLSIFDFVASLIFSIASTL